MGNICKAKISVDFLIKINRHLQIEGPVNFSFYLLSVEKRTLFIELKASINRLNGSIFDEN